MKTKYQSSKIVISLFILLVVLSFEAQADIKVGSEPQKVEDIFRPEVAEVKIETWAKNLTAPWELVFLPDSERALVTERPGRILLFADGELRTEPYAQIDVSNRGEGGLLGMAHHPDFPQEPYIYIMYTYQADDGSTYNRVARLVDKGRRGEFDKVIIDQLPGAIYHNGGRIEFGPDGMLYITTGETFNRPIAQNLATLGGKILRLTPAGEIPADNPFDNSPVYSLGHRNPQGLAWHSKTEELFITDHGPSGEEGLRAKDMVKVIKSGGNYGWPNRIGYFANNKYLNPLIMWKDKATPPSGAAFYRGDLFIATLRSEALIRVQLSRDSAANYQVKRIERWFAEDSRNGKYGRLRTVTVGPDGYLYLLTNNRDGRGDPNSIDDRILKIMPQ